MKASAIPGRVPLGFVCGYPVGSGGELYGGSMFAKSAATDTLQGRAIHAVNERWGSDFRRWNGRETIGIPVCKKKYAPFDFKVRRVVPGPNGERERVVVTVERMFGCHCHSLQRREVIERHGVRKGWEPFGQWSMGKAKALAKRETERLNGNGGGSGTAGSNGGGGGSSGSGSEGYLSGDSGGASSSSSSTPFCSDDERQQRPEPLPFWKNMCNSGQCAWKYKDKYDDVFSEIHDSDSDDNECWVSTTSNRGGSNGKKMPRRDSDSLPLSALKTTASSQKRQRSR